MEVNFDIIHGLSFGLEYVTACPEADVPNPCIVIDIAFFRWILEITG